MRILVLLPSLLDLIGGIQTYSQALVWSLNSIGEPFGWTIEVLALHDHRSGGSTTGLDRVQHRGFDGSKFAFSLAALRAAPRADVILIAHIHFASLLHAMRWVAPQASCRISIHGIEVWKRFSPWLRSAVRHADQIWPVSDYSRRRMVAENPELEGMQFELLPNTLGPSYPPTNQLMTREQLGLSPTTKLVLCVSRMSSHEPYKNVELLIRSMPAVLEKIPDAQLVLVGPGDDRPRLERIVKELGLDGRVLFPGKVSDEVLQSYLATCDLFALPSTGEGFGIVYLEAMYHGKACLGASAGGVPEVIEDGVTGLLAAPDLTQVQTALLGLLQDEHRRAQMGLAGRERLHKHFSLASFQSRLEGLLRR